MTAGDKGVTGDARPVLYSNTALVRRYSVLASLYFAQGLPFGFFSHAVPVLLNRTHPPELVGLSSLLALPGPLKFLWAPFVDGVEGKRFGRRRSVIVPLQLLSIVVLVALAFSGASDRHLTPLLVGFFLVSLLSATQDIATDALSLDLLRAEERGRGGAIQAGAYRAGMIGGAGGILAMIDYIGVREAFLLMAALVALTTLPLIGLQEPPVKPALRGGQSLRLLGSFFKRGDAWLTIALLFAFKIGDALAAGMVTRWFVKQGLSTTFIAMSRGTVGGVAAIVGAVLGGFLMRSLGGKRALVALASVQGLAIAVYVALDWVHPIVIGVKPMAGSLYFAASAIEHLAGGAATAAIFTHMMNHCRDEARGTDFTVQACVLVAVTGLGLLASGFVTKALGLSGLLWVASALGLMSPLMVWLLLRRSAPQLVDLDR